MLAVGAETIGLVAGQIASIVFASIAFLSRYRKSRSKNILETGLVPLKYFEQVAESQAAYITTLERRVEHILGLLRQSEVDKQRLEAELDSVRAQLAEKRRELHEALRELERYKQ